ncbi:MAG: hypothetical protein QXW00_00310 [Candidatus Woesearchaeota archaeon]
MFFSRKGEKELQMIFGLFVLLIISLVVLSLFFKFTEKSSGKMEGASTEYFTKATIDKAIQTCQGLCEAINDDNTLIEFCKRTIQVDWNGNQNLKDKVTYGKWQFCEDKVPCFVLVDKCQNGKYTGETCKNTLLDPDNNNLATYDQLAARGLDDGCGLDTESQMNWKVRFGFTER